MSTKKARRDEKFIAVYRAYVDEVYQFVYLRTGASKVVAEDLTQEIFFAVYKGLSGFRGLSSERTWVFQVAKNRLNDFYRRQYRPLFEHVPLDGLPGDQLADSAQDVQENQMKELEQAAVRACLAALPKQYEIVLTLKYMDGQSTKEIAALLGKTPKAIESLLRRAKNAFMASYVQTQEKRAL